VNNGLIELRAMAFPISRRWMASSHSSLVRPNRINPFMARKIKEGFSSAIAGVVKKNDPISISAIPETRFLTSRMVELEHVLWPAWHNSSQTAG